MLQLPVPILANAKQNYETTKCVLFFFKPIVHSRTFLHLVVRSLGVHFPPTFPHQLRNDLNH